MVKVDMERVVRGGRKGDEGAYWLECLVED